LIKVINKATRNRRQQASLQVRNLPPLYMSIMTSANNA